MSDETNIDGLEAFDKYGPLFKELTKRTYVDTDMDVISIIITYDSKYCIAIVTAKDEHFQVQGYSLTTFKRVFEKNFYGTYIKMNIIEQNVAGDTFAIGFQDNGKYYMSFLNTKGEELDHLNVSKVVNIDDKSRPITGFSEPLVTGSFLPDGNVFISAYHRIQRLQYSFLYSYQQREVLS